MFREQCYEENCLNGTVSLSKAIILLLVNRGQATPHPSQQRKLKQSKSCWTLIVGCLFDSDRRMTIRDITIRTGNTFGAVFRIFHNELVLRRICARLIPHMIDENRPGMLQTATLHHDNALSHRAAQTKETIRLGLGFLDHPFTHQTWPLRLK